MTMQTFKPVDTMNDAQARETDERTAAGAQGDVRALSDFELWFVGGGEDTPHW